MDWYGTSLPPVVDAHVHINRFDLMKPACRRLIEENPSFCDVLPLVEDPDALVDRLDKEGVEEVWAINYCARDVMGYGAEVNDWASDYVAAHPDRIKSTGGYDPRHDGDGDDAAQRLADLGLIGCKIHPVHQHLSPDVHRDDTDEGRRMEAFYAACERLGLPVWFHTGTSIFPGADNSYQDVAPVGVVAQDFPRLRVVLCHGGRPDQCDEAMRMLETRLNVWMDVSSMPPQRIKQWFPGIEAVAERVLWGTDWPGPKVPGMAENVVQFLAQGWPAEVARMILAENARRLLKS